MKAIILAGGLGTRISEESHIKPKPMVEIGGLPILWHIMKHFSVYGINDFIICVGYKGHIIKDYFYNYKKHHSNFTVNLNSGETTFHSSSSEPWTVTILDTGQETMTGGRLKIIEPYLTSDDFCMTYGDAVSDVNISKLISFHKAHNKLATLTAVHPVGRFGHLQLSEHTISSFEEKPAFEQGYINGGFFVLSPKVLNFIENEHTIWEQKPIQALVKKKELLAYKHQGFWHCMDTLSDKNKLEMFWNSGAPWKTWD